MGLGAGLAESVEETILFLLRKAPTSVLYSEVKIDLLTSAPIASECQILNSAGVL